jgi:hypothetical protein
MGWTSYNMNKPIKEWFKDQWDYDDSDYEVLDSALVKRQTLYGAVKQKSTGEIFCAVYLIRWTRGYYNFTYKDMTEFAGPVEYECPPKIFKLLTPLNDENDPNGWARKWRGKVEKLHETRKRLSKGAVIKLKEPVKFTNGKSYQYFLRRGKRFYVAEKGFNGKYYAGIWVRYNPLLYFEFDLIDN